MHARDKFKVAGITDQQIYEMVMQSQYWPPDQMRDFQRSQVAQLLRHAKANVPFYKTRLDCMFKADGSIDWGRWTDIPILTRKDLHDHRDAMQATVIPHGHGKTATTKTSGSSGHRVEITKPTITNSTAKANWLRYMGTQNLSAEMATASFAFFDGESERDIEYQYTGADSASQANWQPKLKIRRNLSAARKLELLKSLRISALHDFSSSVEILARENLALGFGLKLKNIFCYGMVVTAEQRALFAKSFGAKTAVAYSSEEVGMIGYPCETEIDYHTCNATVMVELLDDNGKPVMAGQPGRVVVTSLFNSAQPIIRYNQGDLTSWAEPCSCGRTNPRLAQIKGRNDPIFHFPDRHVTPSGSFFSDDTGDFLVTAFQLAQVGPLHIEVRYLRPTALDAAEQNQMIAVLKYRLHPNLSVTFNKVQDIPYNPGGKQQRYVREWNG